MIRRRPRLLPPVPHRFSPLQTLDYHVRVLLVFSQLRLFTPWSTAADVYDASGLLREGVLKPTSRFHFDQLGPVRFNELLDWLAACGYPVEALRIPTREAVAQ